MNTTAFEHAPEMARLLEPDSQRETQGELREPGADQQALFPEHVLKAIEAPEAGDASTRRIEGETDERLKQTLRLEGAGIAA
ncbi:MAG: hypothetical protein PHS95_02275 [Candidatus Pacebacteria bacterium]|nr:hypothetical protein [Candidatus Paceibacterota bacterium]